jgi:hypothetical protein
MPTGKTDPLAKPIVCVTIKPAQFSDATGEVQLTTAPHEPGELFTVMFKGQEVNTGGSLSFTVTVNEQVLTLPTASVAVYEIVVTPWGKLEPLNKPVDCVTVTPAQLSLAVGTTQLTGALQTPGNVETVMFDGQVVNEGTSPSETVMVKEQFAALPAPSVAVNTMFDVPIGKNDPPGNPVVCVNVTPEQLSLAIGATQLTKAPHKPGVFTTEIFGGQNVKTGS